MPASRYNLGGSINATEELTLPSREVPSDPNSPHNVCLVRRVAPAELMSSGMLDRLDGLAAIVQMTHLEPKGLAKRRPAPGADSKAKKSNKPLRLEDGASEGLQILAGIKDKMGSLDEALDLIDRVVEMALVEPAVLRPVVRDELGVPVKRMVGDRETEVPLPAKERKPDTWYTDMIDLADKSAIMAFAMGGVKDLESFRD